MSENPGPNDAQHPKSAPLPGRGQRPQPVDTSSHSLGDGFSGPATGPLPQRNTSADETRDYTPQQAQPSQAQQDVNHTQVLYADAPSAAPAQHAPSAAYKPAPSGNRDNKKMWAVAGGSALLAALLSSGATFGMVAANGGQGLSTGNTTVVNANPKDFADAGNVNWAATAAKVSPAVVSIVVGSNGKDTGQGSGVIIDADGNIVTNNHVVEGASEVQVTLNDNKTYKASIVGTDPSTDLAVIRIKGAKDLKPLAMADDKKLVVGQPVMAVGNPLGLSGTATTGIVSALNRPVSTSESSSGANGSDGVVVTNAIQTSAAINPGNSGGALVNGSGELIGINSSIASLNSGSGSGGGQSGNIGIGFAIPTSVVKNISSQLIKSGKASHALLGISTTNDQVTSGDAVVTAARVKEVVPGGAAEKAGVRKGDVVVAMDGIATPSSNALVAQVRARMPGSKVKLTIVRGGETKTLDVTLGSKETT